MTRQVHVGPVAIGGGAPVSIQSMCNTPTENVDATVAQILRLKQEGCDIVRVAVPTREAAMAIPAIKSRIHIPLVADIHFDYKAALACAEVGVDKVRAGLLPEMLTAMVDYDSDAIHDGSEKIHKDAERRNELQLLNGVAYFTVTTDQASDYDKLVRLCERIRRKLHRRKRPIFYKPMTEEARYFAQTRVETKRFKLWQTVIAAHRYW